eukprot:scaffold67915_cov54-Phaeocystis_antarctica.AAC.1
MCSRSSGAVSRTPARAIASRGEGRGACPRATDEQLVGVGQGVCALPSRKQGARCGARCGLGAGKRGPAAAHERHARREGPAVEAGGARACAERTLNM